MAEVGHFKILGPLEIWRADQRLPLYGPRQERVLLALLLSPDLVVPFDHLIDAVWDEDPPASARRQIQDAVARIRGVFATGGLPREIIVTTGSGYRLDLAGHRLDQADFDRLVSEAKDPSLPDAEAVRRLRAALDLWRVADLSGAGGGSLQPALAALDEKRLTAWESLLRLEIELGNRREYTAELRQLVARYPLREPLVALLMSALAAEGRVAEAVAAYDELCRRLDEELGVDPGPLVRRTRAEILQVSSVAPPVATPAPRAVEPEPDRPIPAQLPPAVGGFVGREAELSELDALLDRSQRPAVVLSAVTGTAGVGKTALAVHWGQRVISRFPDGQLYIDLRGYDPRHPLSVAEALDQLLAAFGVTGADVPVETPARAALLRTLVKGRRLLLLLDNAATPEQVRGLLPGDRGPMVLITSRSSLAGLIARDGAHRIALDRLPLADALALLRELVGPQVDREPEAARELVELCARLPLALRIAAEQASGRTVQALVERLRDERHRLDVLDAGGDEATAVRSVLSWSYQQLDPAAARTFRMLALTPAPDISAEAVAVLIGAPVDETRRLIDELLRANLAFRAAGGRYGLHDLLRAYGREVAEELGERTAAEERLLEFYLNTTIAADHLLFPNADSGLGQTVDPDTQHLDFAGREEARAWLDAERAPYLTLMDLAADDWPGHAVKLATAVMRYLDNVGHHADAAAVHSHALAAARKLGDRARESAALSDLGVVYYRWGQHATAADYFGAADEAARESGNLRIELRNALNLGLIYEGWGRLDEAEEQYRRVLDISGSTGNEFSRLSAHRNLADVAVHRNQFDKAAPHYRESIRLAQKIGNSFGVALAQQNLALIDLALGRLTQAEDGFRQAGAVFGELGYPSAEAQSTDSIGSVRLRQGRPLEALEQYRTAFQVFESLGEPDPQAETLVNMAEALTALGRYDEALDVCARAGTLADRGAHADNIAGDALRGLGRLDEAVKHHRAALATASESGDEAEQARAHRSLADDLDALGRSAAAQDHRHQAVVIYRRLGLPEADEIAGGAASAGGAS